MAALQEMARLVREELVTLIQPVQLLSVNPNQKTGAVTGRFRSNGLLFDYNIGKGRVRYKPVGASGSRSDAANMSTAQLVAELQLSRKALQGRWQRHRLDGYRAVAHRLDAKNCNAGYGCGSTCIERSKECRVQGGKAAKELGGMVKGASGAADGGSNNYKGYDLTPPPNPGYEGSNAQVKKITKALRDRVGQLEPAVSRQMIDLAGEYGAKMDGLAYRLKAEKSLGRKIENEAKGEEFDGNVQAAADSMSDVVRYTMKTTNERYTDTLKGVVDHFEGEGWNARVKNYWQEGQPYRGVNVALTSPEGLKVELQFHTPQSLYVKHKTHPIYEQYRVETSNQRRRQLFDRMIKITDSLVPPWGAASSTGQSRSPQVRAIQGRSRSERERLMQVGQRKFLGFQTAEEAGLV
jgi:hypothetical protein